ncbi:MAG: ferrous iron transport protein B [Deltaproteobacteria bacterium]|nr:ferrous iron transport protein B [Deltaproteobacteria bacterium]
MPQPDHLHINRIAIVGNPNVGKSSLFNGLTRAYSLVANVPHTTMEVSRAPVRIDGKEYEVIDTPGILSLDLPAEDGLATREILLQEHPEVIILCLDSNNLKRSLLLAAQVMELDIPLVVCLNFIDESRLKGIGINRKKLEALLQVPVVETVASEGHGVRELLKAIHHASIVETAKVPYPPFIEQALDELSACFPEEAVPADGFLLLLLSKAPGIERYLRAQYGAAILDKAKTIGARAAGRGKKDIANLIFEERSRWAERVEQSIVEHTPTGIGRFGEALGALSRHPVWGWAVLLLVMYCTYLLVGRVGIGILVPLLEDRVFAPLNSHLAAAIPWEALRDFLLGDYGLLTTGFENALGTVLPVLAMFFLVLNLLEDTGYIANLCVLSNRAFQPLGLSGKSILPLVLGFGCRTMAVLTTRILESKKERIIAVFLISCAIPCAPLLGVSLAILALLPFSAVVAVFGVIAARAIVAGLLLNRFVKADLMPDFIIEIPPVRLPNLKNLMIKTYYRLKWFTIEAVPLFMIGAVLLFIADKIMVLALIKKGMEPLVGSLLHLPGAMVDALLLCLLRLEAGAVIVLKLARIGELDSIQTIVAVVVITGFTPCFANIMAIVKELGIKTAAWMVAVITAAAFIVGGLVNFILRI